MLSKDIKCSRCEVSGDIVQLERCPVCYAYFCADCVYRGTGRRLCSERCGQILLYGDEDEQERDLEDEV